MISQSLKSQSKNAGQILIIVLITMMMLAITVVTITNNIIRDSEQSVYNTQYENLYSVAEKHVIDTVHEFGFEQVPTTLERAEVEDYFERLNYDLFECVDASSSEVASTDPEFRSFNFVRCTFTDPSFTDEAGRSPTVIYRITDLPYFKNYSLSKDEFLVFDLEGNSSINELVVSWTEANPNVGIEIIVDFKYKGIDQDHNNGIDRYHFSSIRGIYSADGVFNNTDTNNENNYFFGWGRTQTGNSVSVDLSSVRGKIADRSHSLNYFKQSIHPSDPDIEFLGLRVKPYMQSSPGGSVEVSVTPDVVSADHKTQSRFIEATAFFTQDDSSLLGTQPFVNGSIPAYKPPAILDYVIRSSGLISAPEEPLPSGEPFFYEIREINQLLPAGSVYTEEDENGETVFAANGKTTVFSPLFKVDVNKKYVLKGEFKSVGSSTVDTRLYFGLAPYTEDKKFIGSEQVIRRANAFTVESFTNNTVTTVEGVTGWCFTNCYAYQKQLAFYYDGDTESHLADVILYPRGQDGYLIGEEYGAFSGTEGNTLNLNMEIPEEVQRQIIPGTTKIMNQSSGGTYMYAGASGAILPHNSWREFTSAPITGEGFNRGHNVFRQDTEYARILFLLNYKSRFDDVPTDPNQKIWFKNVRLEEIE